MTSGEDWPNILRLPDYQIGAFRETEHDYHIQIETHMSKMAHSGCHTQLITNTLNFFRHQSVR
ncbi:hypothetical protein [Acidithiobacillus sp. IBUN Pt1247-S3]|uniref:hypothetical protein n=1 Tax=Acidithiobacillus sp. IBUN Pt1247-S3 TaxID=3166642 RepID=UPI0034E472BC